MIPPAIHIRRATLADAPAISALMYDLQNYFVVDMAAAEKVFLPGLSVQGIALLLQADDMDYWVARQIASQTDNQTGSDDIVGVIALKAKTHVYHLCVARALHGQGLGRQLWLHAAFLVSHAMPAEAWTVNASLSAVPFYQRLGFKSSGAPQQQHGIAFQPMQRLGVAGIERTAVHSFASPPVHLPAVKAGT